MCSQHLSLDDIQYINIKQKCFHTFQQQLSVQLTPKSKFRATLNTVKDLKPSNSLGSTGHGDAHL